MAGKFSFLAATVTLTCAASMLFSAPSVAGEVWSDLNREIFNGRTIQEDDGVIVLEAPQRAHDGAQVPITIKSGRKISQPLKALTIIVDVNPAPIAATISFGPAAGDLSLYTSVRVNAYSNVRAIVELADGSLHMATQFVKASGGCSAPAIANDAQALADIGQMQLRMTGTDPNSSASRSASLAIRHPNNSGLQMNQLTGYYIPARFVNGLEIKRGEELILRMESGISLSEDPNLGFTFRPDVDNSDIIATGKDTDGREFRGRWPVRSQKGA